MQAVKAAYASGQEFGTILRVLLEQLGDPQDWTLGLIYVTDPLASDLGEIIELLQEATGIKQWAGTIGVGILCMTGQEGDPGAEYHDVPAISVLVAKVPESDFCLFEAPSCNVDAIFQNHGAWIRSRYPGFGIVHGDPRNPAVLEAIDDLGRDSGSFLVGGLSAAPSLIETDDTEGSLDAFRSQSADGYTPPEQTAPERQQPAQAALTALDPDQVAGHLSSNGITGVLFAGALETVTGLSQGCMPIGPSREVTEASRNIMISLDNRPTLTSFLEDVGPEIAADLQQVAGRIYAALPIEGSDNSDYLVRNLLAIDPNDGWIAIAEEVAEGDQVMFCIRDQESARADMWRMLEKVQSRCSRKPRAGLYYSCIARGPSLFDPTLSELSMIRSVLGDFPLIGFFGNGEISNSRVYGYTGILTLFL